MLYFFRKKRYNKHMEQTLQKIKAARRIVVKVGTSTLTHENGGANLHSLSRLVRVLSAIHNSQLTINNAEGNNPLQSLQLPSGGVAAPPELSGHCPRREVILVTSGAMGVGVSKLGMSERPKDTPGRQAAAAVGQCILMTMYDRMFGERDQLVAQLLLTRRNTETPESRRNLQNTFERLLELGVLPIVNENDSVAVEELEDVFGDNDNLSAKVAQLIGADLLLLLTDTDGLFDSNPRENPNAAVISFVPKVTDEVLALADGKGSARGTGGMMTKLLAAQSATQAGIPTVILNGNAPEQLYDLLDAAAAGTIFGVMDN
ncbi:MAG: glutamate 5-kinase [Oscillospiraceae bacterium]|jgi:glutamate 5-kinase|nr:glutamate 5-kinase [Oscillospiraceae bacterium]